MSEAVKSVVVAMIAAKQEEVTKGEKPKPYLRFRLSMDGRPDRGTWYSYWGGKGGDVLKNEWWRIEVSERQGEKTTFRDIEDFVEKLPGPPSAEETTPTEGRYTPAVREPSAAPTPAEPAHDGLDCPPYYPWADKFSGANIAYETWHADRRAALEQAVREQFPPSMLIARADTLFAWLRGRTVASPPTSSEVHEVEDASVTWPIFPGSTETGDSSAGSPAGNRQDPAEKPQEHPTPEVDAPDQRLAQEASGADLERMKKAREAAGVSVDVGRAEFRRRWPGHDTAVTLGQVEAMIAWYEGPGKAAAKAAAK